MPQNNQNIIESKEFQDFVKDNNLFPLSYESFAVLAFKQNSIIKGLVSIIDDMAQHIDKQQVRIAELGKNIHVTKYEDGLYKDETLFDKWSR